MNTARRLPAPAPYDDPFAATAEQQPNESPIVVFQRLHRLLRGRYWIAAVLAGLGGAAGAIGGWMATEPLYRSVGSIRILSNVPVKIYADALNQQMFDFNAAVQTQANLISDHRVIDMAIRSQAWKAFNRGSDPVARERFRDALSITTSREEPGWIRVKFLDPDAQAAQVAVQEVIMAYVDVWGREEMIVTPGLIQELNTLRDRHESDANTIELDIQAKRAAWGGIELPTLQKAKFEAFTELNRQIADLDAQISQGTVNEAQAAEAGAAAQQDPVVLGSTIARDDPYMRALLDEYNFAAGNVARLKAKGAKEANPSLQRAESELNAAKQRLTDGVERYIAQNGTVPGSALMGPVSEAVLETMNRTKDALVARRDVLKDEIAALSADVYAVERLSEELRKKKEDLAAVERRLTILTTESDKDETMSSRIKIVSHGEMPISPYVDRRKKLAAMGVFFGGGFPIGMIMLLGLLDGKFRYSDQAGDRKRHVPLLGILPFLPARMHDPEQAAVAAHCVHQIRTLLQISGQMHDRRVFCITSPTAGDGKTSLSLSLGLSFAASGSETCLIDFDMIGGGLTSGMQAKTESGLMDAIDAGTIDGFVKPTSFPRLSILPVGRDDAREVSRLSPTAVRAIIEEAKKRFEIVVMDTGPILGSIEASLACAAADGVILALGRGQQRSHADRAVEYIHTLGANLLGIVFNRAQAQDFKRSVSSASVRSVPVLENGSGNGHASRLRALPALGPMASTVATAIRDDRDTQEDADDDR